MDKLQHEVIHQKTPFLFVGGIFATTSAAACLSHCAFIIFCLSPNAPSTTSAGAFVVRFARHSLSAWL